MILEIHNRLGAPQQINATRVLVRGEYGDPLVLVLEHAPGQYFYKSIGDPDFEQTLEALGISNTTVVTNIDPGAVEPPPGQLLLP